MIRSSLFNLSFYLFTFFAILFLVPLIFLPGRRLLMKGANLWAKGCLWLLKWIGGISIKFDGKRHLPKSGPYLIAAKHQSEVDGIAILATIPNVVTIAMQELGRYPVFGRLMKKMQMILVDSDGGVKSQNSLTIRADKAVSSTRPILIYPEGRLVPVGEKSNYKSGIYHLYDDFSLPVVPVATNIGLRWPQRKFRKQPGTATIEFLPPIFPGLEKQEFMELLSTRVESRSNELAGLTSVGKELSYV